MMSQSHEGVGVEHGGRRTCRGADLWPPTRTDVADATPRRLVVSGHAGALLEWSPDDNVGVVETVLTVGVEEGDG